MAAKEIVELAREASKGNREAFTELCMKKQREIIFFAYGILGDMTDAEDVAQETILSMFRSFYQLKEPEKVDAWVAKIVTNHCYQLFNKRAKRAEDLGAVEETAAPPEVDRDFLPEQYCENVELADELYDIVQKLPQKQRETILLYYYENLNYRQIAEVMGVSLQTVSTNLMWGRAKVKEMLIKIHGADESGLI
ncbi:MAG: RNA polymerase sigma factor [Clostridiales Family XIII bacterium]|jgi:RNA polymerase sigma-70 factor (ECF subfamily)|nr:RNA polymerase sigma factor [Clostridiales Family XIII bacterium]